MGKLREQMKGNLELKGLSPHTQEIYLRQVNQFSRHHGRSPRQLHIPVKPDTNSGVIRTPLGAKRRWFIIIPPSGRNESRKTSFFA